MARRGSPRPGSKSCNLPSAVAERSLVVAAFPEVGHQRTQDLPVGWPLLMGVLQHHDCLRGVAQAVEGHGVDVREPRRFGPPLDRPLEERHRLVVPALPDPQETVPPSDHWRPPEYIATSLATKAPIYSVPVTSSRSTSICAAFP